MDKRGEILLLVLLITLLIGINYKFIDDRITGFLDESDSVIVERVIDGDTIVVDNNIHVRLLGINTPEKKEFYHDEAMNFLINLTLNKTVKLEYGNEKKDLYGRTLAYIIIGGKNINPEIVREGFANPYIYNKDKYTSELRQAWNECVARGKNLCEKSKEECTDCIELEELNVKNQIVRLYNKCNFNCDLTGWNIKDEGRKNFFFPDFILGNNEEAEIIVGNGTGSNNNNENNKNVLYWKGEDYVWTSTGDTLFLRDEKGKLILWRNY